MDAFDGYIRTKNFQDGRQYQQGQKTNDNVKTIM